MRLCVATGDGLNFARPNTPLLCSYIIIIQAVLGSVLLIIDWGRPCALPLRHWCILHMYRLVLMLIKTLMVVHLRGRMEWRSFRSSVHWLGYVIDMTGSIWLVVMQTLLVRSDAAPFNCAETATELWFLSAIYAACVYISLATPLLVVLIFLLAILCRPLATTLVKALLNCTFDFWESEAGARSIQSVMAHGRDDARRQDLVNRLPMHAYVPSGHDLDSPATGSQNAYESYANDFLNVALPGQDATDLSPRNDHLPAAPCEANATDASQLLTCSICIMPIVANETVSPLPCAHLFHTTCIVRWLLHGDGSTTCPNCRLPLE